MVNIDQTLPRMASLGFWNLGWFVPMSDHDSFMYLPIFLVLETWFSLLGLELAFWHGF